MKVLNEEDIELTLSTNTLEILDLVYSSLINEGDKINLVELNKFFIVVEQKELKGFYAIFYKYIKRIKELNALTNSTKIKISDKAFENYLNINITAFLSSEEIQLISVLNDMEIDNVINIQDDLIIRKKAFDYCIKKYKMIKSLGETSSNLILNLDNLLSCVINDYLEYSIFKNAEILSEGTNLKSLTLIGSEDSFNFTKLILNIIEEKKNDYNLLDENILDLSSIEKYREASQNANLKMFNICEYGFPPIDKIAHMTNQDIITLVASEGTGKTTYFAATAAKELFAGRSIIFMAGETAKLKIANMILSHFIYLRTSKPNIPGMRVSWLEIQNKYDSLPDTIKAEIDRAKYDIYENKKFGFPIIVESFKYQTYMQEVLDIKNLHPDYIWGHVFVDHIDALDRDNSQGVRNYFLKDSRDLIKEMYRQAIKLKNHYGIPTIFSAHTSYEAEKAIVASKKTGVRVGASSSSTSKDVDVEILFETNDELSKHNLIKISLKKFRNYDITLFEPFVVLKEFDACLFTYSTTLQGILNNDNEKMLDIKNIKSEELLD